jgi:hypothetical protein
VDCFAKEADHQVGRASQLSTPHVSCLLGLFVKPLLLEVYRLLFGDARPVGRCE